MVIDLEANSSLLINNDTERSLDGHRIDMRRVADNRVCLIGKFEYTQFVAVIKSQCLSIVDTSYERYGACYDAECAVMTLCYSKSGSKRSVHVNF